jgi:ribonuclease-3
LYTFEERTEEWICDCSVDGIKGWGRAAGKKAAKKKAAFVVLVRLMESAGLGTEEMKKAMWGTMEGPMKFG